MKSLISISLVVSISIFSLSAQWTKVSSNTDHSITDINFVDSVNGFISCTIKTILKTSNGGLNWSAVNTGISASFTSVFGINKDTLYTARISLYKSTNSGGTWNEIGGFVGGSNITDLNFTSPKTGFLIKSDKLYKTDNYGLSWLQVYDNVYSNGRIIFPCKDTGYVVGGYEQLICGSMACDPPIIRGSVIKTVDGGNIWQKLNFFNDALCIVSASFINSSVGYCFTSDNAIHKTENGGLDWTTIKSGITGTISDGLFINDSIGFIITWEGNIYITVNKGLTWKLDYEANAQLNVLGGTKKTIIAGGNTGRLYRRSLDDLNVNVKKQKYFFHDLVTYPNPANNYIIIENKNSTNKPYVLILRNVQGKLVFQEKININIYYNLKLNGIKSGIYYLTLLNDKDQIVKKIVIQK